MQSQQHFSTGLSYDGISFYAQTARSDVEVIKIILICPADAALLVHLDVVMIAFAAFPELDLSWKVDVLC